MPTNDTPNGLTLSQIADRVGVHRTSVKRKTDIERFAIGKISSGGAPCIIYDPKVLSLFGKETLLVAQPARSVRADRGQPRSCDAATWSYVLQRVKGLYIDGNAQQNLNLACENALDQLKAEGLITSLTASQIYRRLTRRSPDASRETSPFYTENWEMLHQSNWRKHDTAKSLPTVYYDWQSYFEDAGWAGAGFGVHAFWSMDGHKGDAWTLDENGKPKFPYYIYIRDTISGYPLLIEPVKSESTESVIRALVKCMLKWRAVPVCGIAMDNAVSNMTAGALGVIASMIDPAAYNLANDSRFEPVYGKAGSPVIRNLPNIPRAPIKAAIERSFRQIKDEFDATRYPKVYQGADRTKAVQLMVNNRPSLQHAPEMDAYFENLQIWSEADYIMRSRPDQFPLLVERGMPPTIDAAFAYYGGYEISESLPEPARIAKILYFAAEHKAIVKAALGQAAATINGQWWPVASPALDHTHHGQQVAIVPIPGSDTRALLLKVQENDSTEVEFIGVGERMFVRSVERAREAKQTSIAVQNQIRDSLRAARSEVQPASYRNIYAPGHNQEPLALEAAPADECEEILEIASDTAALLSEIDDGL